MPHATFTVRLFLTLIHSIFHSLAHPVGKSSITIIILCTTCTTYAKQVNTYNAAPASLYIFTTNSSCVDDNNSPLFQNDLVLAMKLDAVVMMKTDFSYMAKRFSALKHSSQHGILRLVKFDFDRSKLAISSLSS